MRKNIWKSKTVERTWRDPWASSAMTHLQALWQVQAMPYTCTTTPNFQSLTMGSVRLSRRKVSHLPYISRLVSIIHNVVDVCGGIIRGSKGVLTSPNYPETYPGSSDCNWWIVGPPDRTLKLQFIDLDLPSTNSTCGHMDSITIYERFPENITGEAWLQMRCSHSEWSIEIVQKKSWHLLPSENHEKGHEVETICGQSKTTIITLATNQALISFSMNHSVTSHHRGFSLNYTSSFDSEFILFPKILLLNYGWNLCRMWGFIEGTWWWIPILGISHRNTSQVSN